MYPGERVGLPPTGRGSLATWGSRVTALAVDWLISMGIAVFIFGTRVVTGSGWTSWMIMATFFVQSAVLTTIAGGSIGQLICRIAVIRLDREPLGLPRALLRAALICLVIPAVIVGTDRRALHDMAVGTAVINRR